MRNIRVLAAALGGVMAINIAACSGADWGTVAETSHSSETPGSSDASDSPSPSSTAAASGPVDIAETKLFKNRPGNAPKRADGTYDYTAPGFKLFDICAELERVDLSKYGLVRDGDKRVESFAMTCPVRPIKDEIRKEQVVLYGSTSGLDAQKEKEIFVRRTTTRSGIEITFNRGQLDPATCFGVIQTPGGALGGSAYGGVSPSLEDNCRTVEKHLGPILSDMLLGEQ